MTVVGKTEETALQTILMIQHARGEAINYVITAYVPTHANFTQLINCNVTLLLINCFQIINLYLRGWESAAAMAALAVVLPTPLDCAVSETAVGDGRVECQAQTDEDQSYIKT